MWLWAAADIAAGVHGDKPMPPTLVQGNGILGPGGQVLHKRRDWPRCLSRPQCCRSPTAVLPASHRELIIARLTSYCFLNSPGVFSLRTTTNRFCRVSFGSLRPAPACRSTIAPERHAAVRRMARACFQPRIFKMKQHTLPLEIQLTYTCFSSLLPQLSFEQALGG